MKKLMAGIFTAVLALSLNTTAFAGQWQVDSTGWWYQNDDSSYFNNGWNWIDGKCYYFDSNGYMLANTTTPDGYFVDASGAWTVNGVVQIKDGGVQTTQEAQNIPQVNSEVPNVEGTYIGSGITCIIANEGNNKFWVECDLEKDYLPDYVGNGVFASPYMKYSFSGNTLIIDELYSGETYQLVKQ